MKVLFISAWYPNSTNPMKGLFVKKHAQAIRSAGVEIEVLALTINSSEKYYEKKIHKTTDEAGIVTHNIELNSRFYKFLHVDRFWQYAVLKSYYLKNIKPQFKANIIHSNVLYPAAVLGYKLSKREKLPHIITEHWSQVDKFMNTSLYANIGKKTYHFAKNITVVSEFLKKSISKHLNNPKKVIVVPNVIDSNHFYFKEKNKNEDKLEFACCAQWRKPKRPDLIFNALNYLGKQMNKKIVLNVIGEGHLINELKGKKWSFEINYLGNMGSAELAGVLHRSDYFLHASDMETFSIVIAEALATGTPVFASQVGAVSELVNMNNGFSIDNSDESWANGLFKLIEKQDFDHKQIAEQARRFNANEIGKQFKDIYEKCLQS
jgi:glycosyltransferase involved in cell wall biosynthesis